MEDRLSASDDTIPSTPGKPEDDTFSDAPHRASSPPSSPPTFPWEKAREESVPTRPTRNAFSVLGKRKALQQVSDNARLTKKQPSRTGAAQQKPLSQMQISLGQEVQKKCKTCGMEYIASSTEDRALHDKYHRQNAEGCDVGKDFLKKARKGSLYTVAGTEDMIAVIDHTDNSWRRKRARAALDVAQRELGAVDIPDDQLWQGSSKHSTPMPGDGRFAMYMYIRGTKCVGVLLAERVKSARRVVRPEQQVLRTKHPGEARPISALSALRARRSAVVEEIASDQPIELAQKDSPASLGISRIWTSPSHRNQGIAIALLDQTLSCHKHGAENPHSDNVNEQPSISPPQSNDKVKSGVLAKPLEKLLKDPGLTTANIEKDSVAFSQPTVAGARLARKWFRRNYGWLVYID